MKILGIINNIYEEFISINAYFFYGNKTNLIFDPSSYGQYFNGLHHRSNYIFKRRWVSPSEIIGREIKSKELALKFLISNPLLNMKIKS